MIKMVNAIGAPSLLDVIGQGVLHAAKSPGRYDLFALTCYFKREAAERLVSVVQSALVSRGGGLRSVVMVVNAADWLKQRVVLKELSDSLHEASGGAHVDLVPVNVPGQLVHSKGYALRSADQRARSGFVVISSGNLTPQGLGFHDGNNIEIAALSTDMSDVDSFVDSVQELVGQSRYDADLLEKHELDYLLGLQLFGQGGFYDSRGKSLGAEGTFRFELSEKGRDEAGRGGAITEFRKYAKDTNSFSTDPLQIGQIFETEAKPFSPTFWRTQSVRTLLGNWAPQAVVELIDETLDQDAEPYFKQICSRATPERLREERRNLEEEVRRLRRLELVTTTVASVESWADRIERLRTEKDLVKFIVFDRQRVPDPLDSMNRVLVTRMVEDLRLRFGAAKEVKGRAAVVKTLLESRGEGADTAFKLWADEAKAELAQWSTKRLWPSDEEIWAMLPLASKLFDLKDVD